MKLIAYWRCLKCGECCRHLTGRRFGLALTPLEKRRLEVLAERRSITLDLRPLTWNGYRITLYQFAQQTCPFLDKDNRCTIYRWRPLVCRMYPLHPYGVSDCTCLDRLQRRGFQVLFPPHLEAAGREYILKVTPQLKMAVERYSLNRGWEPNLPFTFRSTYGSITR